MARGHLGFPQTISYNGHQINRLKTQHTTTTLFFFFVLDEGAWERSHHQRGRLFSFFIVQNQQQLLQSLVQWAATHSDVHDGGPQRG